MTTSPDDNIRQQHEAAAAAIWHWQQDPLQIAQAPAQQLRRQGIMRALAAGAVGGLFLCMGLTTPAIVLSITATLLAASALFSPTGVYATLDRGAHAITKAIVLLGQRLILPTVYLLLLVPCGKLLRRHKSSRLQLQPDHEDSYWQPVIDEPANRENQF